MKRSLVIILVMAILPLSPIQAEACSELFKAKEALKNQNYIKARRHAGFDLKKNPNHLESKIILEYIEHEHDMLMEAVRRRDIEAVTVLSGIVPDLNRKNTEGSTALFQAFDRGDTKIAKALIEAGADLSPGMTNDVTALMLAAMKGYTELIDPLIQAGADVNAATKNGATPLTLASSHGHTDSARALIEAGADLNAQDNRGRTPLMLAAVKGYKETVSVLIDAGANVRVEGDGGVTALRFASRAGHVSIADRLVETGADTAPEPTTIVATVKFAGDKPTPVRFDASSNPECDVNTIEDRTVVINDNGTLRNVVVSVKSGPKGFDRSLKKPVVDQKNCIFDPRITVAKTGQTVVIKDSDQGMHNVRGTLGGQQLFNETTFQGTETSVSLDKSGPVSIECDVHPRMQGWIYVTPNGAARVTNENGKATLSNLSPGEYTLQFWHEQYGTKTKTVEIYEGETLAVSTTFSP